jgi:hypothetical protein
MNRSWFKFDARKKVPLTWRLLSGLASLREKNLCEAKQEFRAKAQRTPRFAKISIPYLSINGEAMIG